MVYSKKYLFVIAFILISAASAFSQESSQREIKKLIYQKRSFYKNHKNTSIFIIQLYNGNEKRAYATKSKFESIFNNYKTIISYKLPEWKVQVGYFYTRLEADIALNRIKKHFEGAIVLEDKI